MTKRTLFEWGGGVAGAILVIFGIAAIFMGVTGVQTVRDNLSQEGIVGTPDSTIPGQKVDTGDEARAFANVMRKHALEATGGLTYAQMGRYLDANGKPTNNENLAAKDSSGQPVENGARNIWVTETALSTALNQAYFAERVGFFGIVTGIAMLLSGIGFIVMVLSGVLRPEDERAAQRVSTSVGVPA
jgi:hypothetical protein